MRKLLDPDQMLSTERIRTATLVLSVLMAAAAAIMALMALISIFTWNWSAAFPQFVFGVGLPLAIWLIVRILSEMLLAQHRLNDRLSVIAERLGEVRAEAEDEPANVEELVVEPTTVETTTETEAEEEQKPKRRRKSAKTDES